jgi:hypothetical protein
MLTPSANRKVPLKKAPRSEALCQPNESAFGEFSRSEICGEIRQVANFGGEFASELP